MDPLHDGINIDVQSYYSPHTSESEPALSIDSADADTISFKSQSTNDDNEGDNKSCMSKDESICGHFGSIQVDSAGAENSMFSNLPCPDSELKTQPTSSTKMMHKVNSNNDD